MVYSGYDMYESTFSKLIISLLKIRTLSQMENNQKNSGPAPSYDVNLKSLH